MTSKYVGVCVFDDNTGIGPGWASVGGAKARRISHFSELPQNVAWVTNLNYRMFTKLNLNKMPNVFDEQYFRSSIKNISEESGVIGDGEEAAIYCSAILQNTYKETCKALGVDDLPFHPYRFYVGLSGKVVPKSVRRSPSHASGFAIQEVMKGATQQNQAMFGVRAPSGSKACPLTVPRANYFSWIMRQRLPSCEGWKKVKDDEVKALFGTQHGKKVRGTDAVINNLLDMADSNALFLSVVVRTVDPFYRDFATFGSGANYQRQYATLPEILNLARFSTLEIGGGYKCGYLSNDDKINIDVTNMFRYSRGLALENIYAALANPVKISGKESASGLSAYLRAYDRIMCQRHAEVVAKNGFTIGSFGTGKIIVYSQESESDLLLEACKEAKLMPPAVLHGGD